MHALIIEDEPLIAMWIEETLSECGFTSFDVTCSEQRAVELASARCPDLITADVELNPGSGIDAVTTICAGPTIPVVFITGTPDLLTQRIHRHQVLVKPFLAQ